jgi:hypothetical protein
MRRNEKLFLGLVVLLALARKRPSSPAPPLPPDEKIPVPYMPLPPNPLK